MNKQANNNKKEKTAKDYFLALSTLCLEQATLKTSPDLIYIVKNSTEKRRENYSLRAKKGKRNRRLEFQRLNCSQFSKGGCSNSNYLIAHL